MSFCRILSRSKTASLPGGVSASVSSSIYKSGATLWESPSTQVETLKQLPFFLPTTKPICLKPIPSFCGSTWSSIQSPVQVYTHDYLAVPSTMIPITQASGTTLSPWYSPCSMDSELSNLLRSYSLQTYYLSIRPRSGAPHANGHSTSTNRLICRSPLTTI